MTGPTLAPSSFQFQPSILSAAWRYRWLVLACVVLALAAGLYQSSTQPVTYLADAQLVIDPAATVVSEGSAATPDRYIAVQVIVLRSPTVAEEAVRVAVRDARGAGADGVPTVNEFLANSTILATEGSDLIEIRFEAETPQKAILGANSLAVAYQDIRRSEAVAAGQAAIDRVNALIEGANDDFESAQDEIDRLRAQSGNEQDQVSEVLEVQLADALARLVDLQAELTATSDPDTASEIRQRIGDIAQQISLYQTVRSLAQSPDLEALLQVQQSAIERRAQLAARRDTLSVDTELLGSGVTSYLPATAARALGSANLIRTVIVMVVFGGLVGSALAYFLTTRRRGFSHRAAPEAVLGVPLLSDIPDFGEERIMGSLPVRTNPHSASAESFRFALAALDIQLGNIGAKSVAVVSAGIGAGKTVVTINTALAAVRQGYEVLVVDADFGSQVLTNLVARSQQPALGLTDAIEGGAPLERTIQEIHLGGGILSLLSKGRQSTTPVDFFRADGSFELFDELKERFDLILIDSPPMLQIAYGSLLARHADALIAVVPHGSLISESQELMERLQMVGKPMAGYIYNRAPLRPEMSVSEGSLRDVTNPPITPRRQRRAERRV